MKWPRTRGAPQILEVPLQYLQFLKLVTSNLVHSLGLPYLPRPIIESHPWEKVGSTIIFLQRLKLATSNLTRSCGLPRLIIKSHTEEKVDVTLCYWSSPKFWGSPLIFVLNVMYYKDTDLSSSTSVCYTHGQMQGVYFIFLFWYGRILGLLNVECSMSEMILSVLRSNFEESAIIRCSELITLFLNGLLTAVSCCIKLLNMTIHSCTHL